MKTTHFLNNDIVTITKSISNIKYLYSKYILQILQYPAMIQPNTIYTGYHIGVFQNIHNFDSCLEVPHTIRKVQFGLSFSITSGCISSEAMFIVCSFPHDENVHPFTLESALVSKTKSLFSAFDVKYYIVHYSMISVLFCVSSMF